MGNVLGAKDTAVKKTGKNFYLMKLTFQLRKTDDKTSKMSKLYDILEDGKYYGEENSGKEGQDVLDQRVVIFERVSQSLKEIDVSAKA